jgi:signal transduction histidine kinase
MNRRLLIQVATPALVLGAVLFVACLAAVWSVNRLQANTALILSQDVAHLQAAQELESDLRQLRLHSFLHAIEPVPARARAIAEDEQAFEDALRRARETANTPHEIELMGRISSGYRRYRAELAHARPLPSDARPADIARWDDVHPIRHVLVPCQELMWASHRAMEQTADESLAVARSTRWALVLLGVLGPLSGLVCGYGIARGLSRSIARLSVQLQDVHAHLDQEVGSIKLRTDGDIGVLGQQLDRLVERVREVLREMDRQRRDILRAEQLAAVGQLAASVAHEVRNPLTGIQMIVDVARRQPDAAGALTAEDLEVIHTEIERIERRVQGLLDFARPPLMCRASADLPEMVRQALRLVETRLRQQGVQPDLRLPERPVAVEVDTDQFTGVLVNLFLNALDAMPRGGRLTVRLEDTGGLLRLIVSDTGAGVPALLADRLFTPFASTKPTGTGLGLSTARRVVEEHGGHLTAANLPEGGACFTIELPSADCGVRIAE